MKVLDVGCGIGGPAREMVKFTGCHVTGLNINQYQVQRATNYAAKECLSHKLDFVQADFMVRDSLRVVTRVVEVVCVRHVLTRLFPV